MVIYTVEIAKIHKATVFRGNYALCNPESAPIVDTVGEATPFSSLMTSYNESRLARAAGPMGRWAVAPGRPLQKQSGL